MHLGMFWEEMPRGSQARQAFQDGLDLVDAAEAWGLDGVWLGELHFTPGRSVLSAPLVVASAVAARTRRLRVGTAVQVLPLGHPLRLAEEVATVDQLSQGRFDFGIGRSGAAHTYEGFGIPYRESQARFQEVLAVLRLAWTGEPVTYQGQFYRVEQVTVAPRPYQEPHPPLRMAATSPETFPLVGRLGLPLFAGLRGMGIPELRTHLDAYRAAWRDAGHPGEADVFLRIPVYAGPTERAAREEPQASILYYFQRQAEFTRRGLGHRGSGPPGPGEAEAARLASLSYEEILSTRVEFGTAAALVDRLAVVRDDLGLSGIVAELDPGGGIPAEQVRRTLRILTHEVLPTFR